MPLIDGKYVTPAWKDGVTPPGLDAAELTAIGQTLEKSQAGVESAQGMLTNLGNVHMWKKTVFKYPEHYYLGETEWLSPHNINASNSIAYYFVSDSISISGIDITLNNPQNIYSSPSDTEETTREKFSGKFIKFDRLNTTSAGTNMVFPILGVYYVPPGFGIENPKSYSMKIQAKKVCVEIPQSSYVVSLDRHAYPDSGEKDGAEYEYQGVMGEKDLYLYGSYVGAGTTGSSAPNSLTFDFPIESITIYLTITNSSSTPYQYPDVGATVYAINLTEEFTQYTGFKYNQTNRSSAYAKISEDKKTVTWYADSASNQFNQANYTYYYRAKRL